MNLPRTTILISLSLLVGCKGGSSIDLGSLANLGSGSSGGSGDLVSGSINTAVAIGKASENFTPEQEYFIGRAFTAEVLNRYPPFSDEPGTRYLNELGVALASASDLPEVFSGYHFVILDSNEINAFAAPGAFICVTRGMIRCCQGEDALAAVLAHEIGHVQNGHGLKAIKNSRWMNAATTAGLTAASAADRNVAALTDSFGGMIDDMTTEILVKGYGRDLERDADRAAVTLLHRVGYDPRALVSMLQEMEHDLRPGGLDFAKTHPKPADRIKSVQTMIEKLPPAAPPSPARQARFDQAMRRAIAP